MYDIFDYWKDKCITEDGDILIEYGYDGCNKEKLARVESIAVVEDWGEPTCFACGNSVPQLFEREDYNEMLISDDGFKKIWNCKEVSKVFDRAHILPKALNGSNEPSNLFCLCHTCHRNSPDTRFPNLFFQWVFEERKNPRQMRIISEVIKKCDKKNIPYLFDITNDIDLNHNTNTHGGAIVDSSIVATLVGCAEERYNKLIQEPCYSYKIWNEWRERQYRREMIN